MKMKESGTVIRLAFLQITPQKSLMSVKSMTCKAGHA
jgi:hypothetical protein